MRFRLVDTAGRRIVRRNVSGERVSDLFCAISFAVAGGGNYH